MKNHLVDLNAPYGICIELHYIFYDGNWIINLNIAPDDETSKRTSYVNNKYETISIETMWFLDDKPSYGTIVEPRNIQVYYQCSSYSLCILDYVKYLVRNHTNWLLMGGDQYIQLWRVLEKILIQSTEVQISKSRECYKSETEPVICSKSTIVCKATIIDTIRKNSGCGESKYSEVQVYFKITSQTNDAPIQRTIDFICGFDKCNSKDTGKRIREAIDNHFQFTPFLTTSLQKIQSSTIATKSTRLTTSKTITTTTKLRTTDIINMTMSYPITDYEKQPEKLTTFDSIIQNGTQFNVPLTVELVTNNDTSLSASICFMICIILFHFFT